MLEGRESRAAESTSSRVGGAEWRRMSKVSGSTSPSQPWRGQLEDINPTGLNFEFSSEELVLPRGNYRMDVCDRRWDEFGRKCLCEAREVGAKWEEPKKRVIEAQVNDVSKTNRNGVRSDSDFCTI